MFLYLCHHISSINFKQYEQPQKEVPANSEVLKALLEQENQVRAGGVAGLPEFQENIRQQSNAIFDTHFSNQFSSQLLTSRL